MLAQSVDSVQVHYDAFRAGTNSGAILELIGVTALVGGVLVATAEGSDEWAIGLTLGGLVPLFWGAVRHVQARDHLSRAVWWYNSTLR
jgi:hypothetical protein